MVSKYTKHIFAIKKEATIEPIASKRVSPYVTGFVPVTTIILPSKNVRINIYKIIFILFFNILYIHIKSF